MLSVLRFRAPGCVERGWRVDCWAGVPQSDFTGASVLTVTGVIKRAMHGPQQDIPLRGPLRGLQYSRQMFTPVTAYLNMLLVDHGIFRMVHLNRHRLSDKAWRS